MSIEVVVTSERLEPKRVIALLAVGLSTALHGLFAIAVAAAWIPPAALAQEQRRTAPPATEAELWEASVAEESTIDVTEEVDETFAQGQRGEEAGTDTPRPGATAPAAATPAKPTATPAPPEAPSRPHTPGPEAARRPSAARPPASTSGAAASSAARSGEAQRGEERDGGGQHRPDSPSVMARFTHDIAEYGSGVQAWATLPVGVAGTVTVTLVVGSDGRLDRATEPVADALPGTPAALIDSVKRTRAALVTKLSPIDTTVVFKVTATVADAAPPPGEVLAISFDEYDAKTRRGGSTFVLGNGRRVTFALEVVSTTQRAAAVEPAP